MFAIDNAQLFGMNAIFKFTYKTFSVVFINNKHLPNNLNNFTVLIYTVFFNLVEHNLKSCQVTQYFICK